LCLSQWGTRYLIFSPKWDAPVTISDTDGSEAIEICRADINFKPERLQGLDIGRAIELEVSPLEDKVVLSNHRHELVIVDLNTKQSRVLDKSEK